LLEHAWIALKEGVKVQSDTLNSSSKRPIT
jgi:hypothetical protein